MGIDLDDNAVIVRCRGRVSSQLSKPKHIILLSLPPTPSRRRGMVSGRGGGGEAAKQRDIPSLDEGLRTDRARSESGCE